ncbi:FKBP-type peptidyl-prolyl cis-trans isomerase N-terminal domain-containing protein [Rahnella laticis]|uniref:FKBP-type peptidyl-prolyl cis-trans isomerase N-terminal domain-containing protein n=1 Tax=Rahnella laticis TaxID=2787622 RepID=UPI0018A276FC|nr:FKBP-type peptidyl-prolyl cis-trans isomerase N-terminal domain-containing protein [Rahnella laticis]MBF7993691.1 hypothetical protein [Rahnella laticis]
MLNLKSHKWLKVAVCLWGGISSLTAKGAETRHSSDQQNSLAMFMSESYQGYDLRALAALKPIGNNVADPTVIPIPDVVQEAINVKPHHKIQDPQKKRVPVRNKNKQNTSETVKRGPVSKLRPESEVNQSDKTTAANTSGTPVLQQHDFARLQDELAALRSRFKLQLDSLNAALNRSETEIIAQEAKNAVLQKKIEFQQVLLKSAQTDANAQQSALKAQNEEQAKQITLLKASVGNTPKEAKVVLNTDGRKRDYVLGQAMVSELNNKAKVYHELGIDIDKTLVLSGMKDGLNGMGLLSRDEMDKSYVNFTQVIGNKVNSQVKMAEKAIWQQVNGKKNSRTENGITYLIISSGDKPKKPFSAVSVSLSEKILDGAKISDIPSLLLRRGESMPLLLKQGIKNLGVGGRVMAYALAKTIYVESPLPPGVKPFSVMVYEIKVLQGAE